MKAFEKVVLTVIGGVGYGEFPEDEAQKHIVKTPYGKMNVFLLHTDKGFDIAFLSRHQGKKHVPPHQVNFQALICTARQIGAPVLSINSVGLMRAVPLARNFETEIALKQKTSVEPSNFADFPFFLPNDFIDFTKNRQNTFYETQTVHTDMSNPYCADMRLLLFDVLEKNEISYSEGIYLCTEGPRFETKAEIQMYAAFADVVGMTGVPEVVLAKEAGLCYASVCVLTNPAAGLSQNRVTADEVQAAAAKNRQMVFKIIIELAAAFKARRLKNESLNARCDCRSATHRGKL